MSLVVVIAFRRTKMVWFPRLTGRVSAEAFGSTSVTSTRGHEGSAAREIAASPSVQTMANTLTELSTVLSRYRHALSYMLTPPRLDCRRPRKDAPRMILVASPRESPRVQRPKLRRH